MKITCYTSVYHYSNYSYAFIVCCVYLSDVLFSYTGTYTAAYYILYTYMKNIYIYICTTVDNLKIYINAIHRIMLDDFIF